MTFKCFSMVETKKINLATKKKENTAEKDYINCGVDIKDWHDLISNFLIILTSFNLFKKKKKKLDIKIENKCLMITLFNGLKF